MSRRDGDEWRGACEDRWLRGRADGQGDLKDVTGDDITGLGAEVAYHLFFSIIPLLIFLTALIGVFSQAIGINNVMSDVTNWLFTGSGMPRETAQVLEGPIRQVVASESGGILSVGALLALWGGKNAVSP
jgi:membrane protein